MTTEERERIYCVLNEIRRVLYKNRCSHRVMNPLGMAERTMQILVYGEKDPGQLWWRKRVSVDPEKLTFMDALAWSYRELMNVSGALASRDAVSYGERAALKDVNRAINSLTQLYDRDASWLTK